MARLRNPDPAPLDDDDQAAEKLTWRDFFDADEPLPQWIDPTDGEDAWAWRAATAMRRLRDHRSGGAQ